jgi:RNA polymerase sigma-70 factor (ECF subfamily)
MEQQEWLAQAFEAERPHLQAVAYRLLGSLAEAEDAVQEAWLCLSRSDLSEVKNLGGWLTTVVARVSLNMLRACKTRREESPEASMLEPGTRGTAMIDPDQEAELADSVGLALLVVLETLTPESGSPSCCTISSRFPSRTSLPLWSVKSPPRGSWRAVLAAEYEEGPGLPTLT